MKYEIWNIWNIKLLVGATSKDFIRKLHKFTNN